MRNAAPICDEGQFETEMGKGELTTQLIFEEDESDKSKKAPRQVETFVGETP